MYKIAIVDDEQKIQDEYRQLFARYSEEAGVEFKLTFFYDGLDLVSNYKAGYDIIFMDIDMQKLNGFKTARILREMDEAVLLIFVTRLAKYAIKGYEFDAFDFLVKPLDYYTLNLKMRKVLKVLARRRHKNVCVRVDGVSKVIPSETIIYVEAMGHNVVYHTTNGNFEVYGKLDDAEKQLEGENFIYCHRSCLINAAFVSEVKQASIVVGDEELPISRLRKKQVCEYMTNYLGKNV